MSDAKVQKTAGQMMLDYFRDFSVLKETRSEYWGIQIINFLDCAIYFAMIAIVTVFLSDDLGMSDTHAGYSVTVFTTLTTLCLFVSGMVTDWLGVKRSLYLAIFALLALRLGMAAVGLIETLPFRGFMASALLALMAPFMAMMQTVFQAANRRFTTGRSRGAGFNLWYLFMNLGAMAGGLLIDLVRKVLAIDNSYIFIAGVIAGGLCVVVTLLMVRREEQLLSPEDAKKKAAQDAEDVANGKLAGAVVEKKTPIQIAKEVFRESAFWKLAVLIALLLGVRAVFTYMYLLMPKYWIRTIGPDVAMGTLQAINPFLIVIGLILFIPLANKFNIFKMLVYGSMISAVSLFPLVIPWQVYSADIAQAHYMMAAFFLVLLTIGEIIWSPKLSEYTAAIAPPGQEGTYLGLTMVPWFLAKTVVSLLSGHMLEKWCPDTVTYPAQELAAKANAAGVDVTSLANQIGVGEVGKQASALNVDLAGSAAQASVETLTTQVGQLGYDAGKIVESADAKNLLGLLDKLGLKIDAVAQQLGATVETISDKLDPQALALQVKLVANQIAETVLGGGGALGNVSVNVQLSLEHGWLTFWNTPAAMWLVLGAFGLAGSLTALALQGWLTAGARWKIDHEADDAVHTGGNGDDDAEPIKPE